MSDECIPKTFQSNHGIGTQNYTRIEGSLIHSFNSRFQDFGQCRQEEMHVFADSFAVPIAYMYATRLPAGTY